MILRLLRPLRPSKTAIPAMLLATLVTVVYGMSENIPRLDTWYLVGVATVGLCIGWLLGRSPLPGWMGALIGSILGGELILLRGSEVSDQLLQAIGAGADLVGELLGWFLQDEVVLDWPALLDPLGEAAARTMETVTLVWQWLSGLLQGEPAAGRVVMGMVWALVVWAMAAWAGWAVRRHWRPLWAIAPAGALMASILSFTREQPSSLVMLLALALPVLALVGYGQMRRRWEREDIDYPTEVNLDMAFATGALTMVLVSGAMMMPTIRVRPIANFARRLFDPQIQESRSVAESLGMARREGQEGVVLRQATIGGLPRRHLIGSGPELSDQVVMLVQVEASPADPPQRFYWRSVTYDRYTSLGWFTSETESVWYEADEPISEGPEGFHYLLEQRIEMPEGPDGLFYRTGVALSVDQPLEVAWRVPPDPGAPPAAGGGDRFGGTIEEPIYLVASWLPALSEEGLRAAGEAYPTWVHRRHWVLPDSLPGRVRDLALELTADGPTPYDKALAIEGYLRTFEYTLDLPAPPIDRDIVDTFLFDLKRGYCDYYASSMVVLARASGLPARLAIGYGPGTYDEESGLYVVTAANAHSWPEIYFPGYGWVPFEPTAALPAAERPAMAPQFELPTPEATRDWAEGDAPAVGGLWGWALTLLWVGLAAGILVMAAWWLWDGVRLWRLSPREMSAFLFEGLRRYAGRLRVEVQSGDTPYELAASMGQRLVELGDRRPRVGRLALTLEQVGRLADLYVRSSYSPHLPDSQTVAAALRIWQGLRWRLLLNWLLARKR